MVNLCWSLNLFRKILKSRLDFLLILPYKTIGLFEVFVVLDFFVLV